MPYDSPDKKRANDADYQRRCSAHWAEHDPYAVGGERLCGKCGETKDVTAFGRNGTRKDGLSVICRGCNSRHVMEWVASNRDLWRESHRRRKLARRARRRDAAVEHVEPLVVLEGHDGLCGICGEDVDPMSFHVDHIIPLALGGEHSYANTQPAHPSCNARKGWRLVSTSLGNGG